MQECEEEFGRRICVLNAPRNEQGGAFRKLELVASDHYAGGSREAKVETFASYDVMKNPDVAADLDRLDAHLQCVFAKEDA